MRGSPLLATATSACAFARCGTGARRRAVASGATARCADASGSECRWDSAVLFERSVGMGETSLHRCLDSIMSGLIIDQHHSLLISLTLAWNLMVCDRGQAQELMWPRLSSVGVMLWLPG